MYRSAFHLQPEPVLWSPRLPCTGDGEACVRLPRRNELIDDVVSSIISLSSISATIDRASMLLSSSFACEETVSFKIKLSEVDESPNFSNRIFL